jgi:HK97 family phage portal protein
MKYFKTIGQRLQTKTLPKRQDNVYLHNLAHPVWMERDYSSFASEAYMKNVVAHRAINMISQCAARVAFKLYAISDKGVKTPLDRHRMLDLLHRPNPTYNGKELMQSLYAYRLISGNAFVLATYSKTLQPLELFALRPDRIDVLSNDSFLPQGFRYRVNNNVTEYVVDKETGWSPILHIKNFHPLSDWHGLSSIEAAMYSIDQHNEAAAWNQALLQNGARPSGAIIVKNADGKPVHLNEEQFEKIRNMVDKTFAGAGNAGRPVILAGGLEWKEMSISPKDMDYVATKHSAARDIALALGMPPQLLGIPGDNTYSNLAEARIALWEHTILPLVENTIEHINHWLTPSFGQNLLLSYDAESIPTLTEKRDAIWERVEKCSFMTENEKRAAVGLGPAPD